MKKNYFTEKLNKGLIVFTLVFCAFVVNTTMAQKNIAWTGATNNNWSTATNWNYPAITSIATFANNVANITLTAANTEIAVGDKVAGFGIPVGATITAIDVTQKIITISPNTIAGVGTPGVNVAFTFATPKAATGAPTIVDIAVIGNGGNPTLASGAYYVGGLTISNDNATGAASTLTIPSNVEFYIETLTNEGVLVKGGNIVNNGVLDIKSSLSGGSNNVAAAYGMTFSAPSVIPTVATEYTYSGSGELFLDTSAGNNFSGGFLFNGVGTNANLATYKLLFNGKEKFILSAARNAAGTAANTHLMRAVGVSSLSSCKIVLGGTGFNFGSTEAGATNGLIAVSGGGVDVSIAEGTTINIFCSKDNPTSFFSMYVFGATSLPSTITNKGTMTVKGLTARSVFSLSAQNNGIVNFVNEGTFEVDVTGDVAGVNVLAITNNGGATLQADVNFKNNGTMKLKNLLNGPSSGSIISMTTFSGAPNLIITNSGTLDLIGSNFNFGSRAFDPNATNATTITGASRIINSGTINTNQEFRVFYVENKSTGVITFKTTPDISPLKLVIFTVPIIHAAEIGSTYKDLNNNVHTVVVTKVSGTGTSLTTHVAYNIVNPTTVNPVDAALPVTLTKTGGNGDDSIVFTAITNINGDNALFQKADNSGTLNTNPGNQLLNFYNGVVTKEATSVLSPGGDNGKGRVVFGPAASDSYVFLGTIKIQASGKTTAGIDYDFLRFPDASDVIDISGATLDVTNIYTPTEATTIDILTTNANENAALQGAVAGEFASVLGLPAGSGWRVEYTILPGKVTLSFDPARLGTADNTFSKFKFNYYPNPTSNQLNLSSEKNISKVELFNILGQKVQSNTVNAAQKQLNISSLQKGIYLMEVSIDNAKKTFKIVKQ